MLRDVPHAALRSHVQFGGSFVGASGLFDDDHADGLLNLDDAVAAVIAAANDAKARTLSELDEHGSPISGVNWRPEMGLAEFGEALLDIPSISELLVPTDIDGIYELVLPSGNVRVTFDRAILEKYVPDIELLTWGSRLLDQIGDSLRDGK